MSEDRRDLLIYGAAIALYMFPILAVFASILLVYLRKEN